jgi:hypothetical protein
MTHLEPLETGQAPCKKIVLKDEDSLKRSRLERSAWPPSQSVLGPPILGGEQCRLIKWSVI